MKSNTRTINGCQINNEFFDLVTNELLPETVNTANFWSQLTTALNQAGTTTQTTDSSKKSCVSLLHPRYALKALNSRWGSLYSALYHEDAIPHSAGLKTGPNFNIARGTRVTHYAKEFLDSAFPLTEGSHKDAVSYLVYYQNLMVILADGSTVSLQTPAHFVAKSGTRDNPDSIVLKHSHLHVEITFDRHGEHGSQDIAHIDNIHIEAPANTLISFRSSSVSEKCQVYKNFKALVKGELSASFDRDGIHHIRRLKKNDCYTAKDGSDYNIPGSNRMILQFDTDRSLTAICDCNNQPVPTTIVDAVIASLILSATSDTHSLPVSMEAMNGTHETQLQTILQQLSAVAGMPDLSLSRPCFATGSTTDTADQPLQKQQFTHMAVAEEELKNTVTLSAQNDAVLKTIHQQSA